MVAATPSPGLGLLINGSPRFLTVGYGASFTADAPVPLQISENGATAISPATLTLFDYGVAQTSAPVQSGITGFTFGLPLSPGIHSVTATSTTAGQAESAASAALNLFVLPAPVNRGIVSGLSSVQFAGGVSAGYSLADLGDKVVVDSGVSAIQLVDGVVGLGINTNEVRLQRLYLGLLGRPADANGLAQYDVQLAGGTSLANVAAQFMAGPEYARRSWRAGRCRLRRQPVPRLPQPCAGHGRRRRLPGPAFDRHLPRHPGRRLRDQPGGGGPRQHAARLRPRRGRAR